MWSLFSDGERISWSIGACLFVGSGICSIASYATNDKFQKRLKDRASEYDSFPLIIVQVIFKIILNIRFTSSSNPNGGFGGRSKPVCHIGLYWNTESAPHVLHGKNHHQLTENLIWNGGCLFFQNLKGHHQSAKPVASTKLESHKQSTLFHWQRIIAHLLSKQRNIAAKGPVQQWQTHRRQTS